MFLKVVLLLVLSTITLCIGDPRIYRPRNDKLSPLPKIRSDPAKYRLPGGTTPSYYEIVLYVDPNKRDSFSGRVSIDITADQAVDQIVLHSNVKNITKISVTNDNSVDLFTGYTLTGEDTHFLKINLTENLIVNRNYKIFIEYVGEYGIYLEGLYLSYYIDDEGNRRYLATTQFEPVSAREAFPCYDEPGLKAVFQINIYAPTGYHAVCNADLTTNTTLPPQENGLNLYAFQPTVKMSTYLIAFVISDFDFLSNLDGGQQFYNKKLRVFARKNAIQFGEYALDFAQKSMAELENYTAVEYAFSKLDNFAIPDFSAGAMENWGLITYREPYLLYEPGVTTTSNLEFVGIIISHENAHMWFGNEVSPDWWDYLWLSEGFATYFEHYGTDLVAPEWRMMEQYLPDCVHRAMSYDSLTVANPMSSSVSSPSEIDNNFNTIAYEKSGSVIRMMEHILGKNNFQRGLRNYLNSIPKGLGKPEILFEGLQKAIENTTILPPGVTVSDIFGLWSTTPGFPIIHAKKSVGDRSITLKQERYFQNKSISNEGEKWWIPITWATTYELDFENTSVQSWFHPETTEHVVDMNLRENAWYILNKQATGYFRIMYDEHNWELLSEALRSPNFGGIHLLNRVQLIDDTLELARSLRLSYNTTFEILHYLQGEVDYIPWVTAYPGILFLNTMMPAADNHVLYKEFVRRIVQKAYEEVGFESNQNDKPDIKMNRNIVMNIACTAGINDCREKSADLVGKWIEDNSVKFDPDLRTTIYCGAMRSASLELWNSLLKKYDNSSSESERLLILRNLACSESDEILKSYLLLAVSADSQMSDTHRSTIIEYTITSGPIGVDNAVDFVTRNFTLIKQIMPLYTVRIINTLRSRVVTKNNADQFEEFANTYGNFNPSERNATILALEVIKQSREWLEDVLYDVDPWLIDNIKVSK